MSEDSEEKEPATETAKEASEVVKEADQLSPQQKAARTRARRAAEAKAAEEAAAAAAAKEPRNVRLINTMFQVLSLEIRKADGGLVGIEIPAKSETVWPKLDDYGADVRIKQRRGFLKIFPA